MTKEEKIEALRHELQVAEREALKAEIDALSRTHRVTALEQMLSELTETRGQRIERQLAEIDRQTGQRAAPRWGEPEDPKIAELKRKASKA